jgi:poly(3-hydroxybutyrate) depolymerase
MRQDSVEAGGRSRTYTVVGPAEGMPSRDLILVYHGSRQTGAKHRKFTGNIFDRLADGNTAVVVYLDGYRGNWNDARRKSSFPARTENVDDVGFTGEPDSTRLPQRAGSPGGTSIERTDYQQQGPPPVTLYTVHGGGHTIPGPRRSRQDQPGREHRRTGQGLLRAIGPRPGDGASPHALSGHSRARSGGCDVRTHPK